MKALDKWRPRMPYRGGCVRERAKLGMQREGSLYVLSFAGVCVRIGVRRLAAC